MRRGGRPATPAPAAAQEAPFLDWNPLLPSVATPTTQSGSATASTASNACIEGTLTEMYRRFDRLYASCDHNSVSGSPTSA